MGIIDDTKIRTVIDLQVDRTRRQKGISTGVKGFIRRILTGFAISQLVFGCAVLEEGLQPADTSPIENKRVSLALDSLRDLEQVDAYIKLNNSPLRKRIQDELKARAAETTDFKITRIRVRFARRS